MRNKPLKNEKSTFGLLTNFKSLKNECNSRKVQQLDEL